MSSEMNTWGREDAKALWTSWGGDIGDVNWSGLDKLVELWVRYGEASNLVGSIGREFLWQQICEGLQATEVLRRTGLERRRWLDVGSGGGLPGLVMALSLSGPGCLVEPRLKRFDFLKLAVAELDLQRVDVRRGRVFKKRFESLDGQAEITRTFASAGARAVMDANSWIEVASEWVEPGGLVLAHVGLEFVPPDGWSQVEMVQYGKWMVAGLCRQ